MLIAALWSHEGERADHLALVCDVYCGFVTFPFGILGQVWYLIVSIPDPCCLSYYYVSHMFQGIFSFICYVSLSHCDGDVSWSAMFACGISWSYSHFG